MGLGGLTGTIRDQSKAAVASATTQFHLQDPSLGIESSRGEEPPACFSVLGVAGSSPGWTSYPNPCPRSPIVSTLKDSSCGVVSPSGLKKNLFSGLFRMIYKKVIAVLFGILHEKRISRLDFKTTYGLFTVLKERQK